MYGRFARAKSAWNETSQYQSCVLTASCAAALLYNNMQSLACTLTTDHLRFHFTATNPDGSTLLSQTCDMGSTSKAKHCPNTFNEVQKACKRCSHTRQVKAEGQTEALQHMN
eukprot:5108227-Amphidinium_carterae.1